MKLVTFGAAGGARVGALRADPAEIVDLTADAGFRDMLALIDAGAEGLDAARRASREARTVLPAADTRLLAPLPEPRQMRDFLCFEMHVRQAMANRHLFGLGTERVDPDDVPVPAVWYRQPVYYKCNRFSVVGPEHEIRWPSYAEVLDYELEFGAVLGRGGADIAARDALSHVFGWTVFNDFSARDAQMEEMQGQLGPAKGKDFDTGNAIGPWLVTADEGLDPRALEMVARVNGEEWSRGSSATMHHGFPEVIAHVSKGETLRPGEFLGSGTVGGGCGLELGRFLSPGDTVELEVTGLGVLRNRVVGTPRG